VGRRIGTLFSAAVAAAAIAAPSSASAATEFGDNCIANNDFSEGVTFFESAGVGNPLPVSAPSGGVITNWRVTVVPVPFGFAQTFKVLRLNPAAKTAQVIAEEGRTLAGGVNSFATRIPVQAGDRLSLFGTGMVQTLICSTPGTDSLIGGFSGNGGGVGSGNPYIELPEEFRIPVAAVLEPDADNDGFGDETQDKCPQNAAVQVPCPVAVIDSFALAKKGKAVVLVATNSATSVTVSGSAKLPKAKKGKKARSSAQAKLAKVTKVVDPGKLVRFTLNFPKSLKSAVAGLPKGKSVTLNLTATAPNLAGPASTDKAKLKLKG
jgi:hypothetical protein